MEFLSAIRTQVELIDGLVITRPNTDPTSKRETETLFTRQLTKDEKKNLQFLLMEKIEVRPESTDANGEVIPAVFVTLFDISAGDSAEELFAPSAEIAQALSTLNSWEAAKNTRQSELEQFLRREAKGIAHPSGKDANSLVSTYDSLQVAANGIGDSLKSWKERKAICLLDDNYTPDKEGNLVRKPGIVSALVLAMQGRPQTSSPWKAFLEATK